MTAISQNAAWLWVSLFRNPKNTLSFGGEGAEMEITSECRAALDELITIGAVTKNDRPDDQWRGREHYKSTEMDLTVAAKETGINPFSKEDDLAMFSRKDGAA